MRLEIDDMNRVWAVACHQDSRVCFRVCYTLDAVLIKDEHGNEISVQPSDLVAFLNCRAAIRPAVARGDQVTIDGSALAVAVDLENRQVVILSTNGGRLHGDFDEMFAFLEEGERALQVLKECVLGISTDEGITERSAQGLMATA